MRLGSYPTQPEGYIRAVLGHALALCDSIKDDLDNPGAMWVDEPVVVDRNTVTSRRPDDLPQFCEAIIEFITARAGVPAARLTRG